MCAAESVSKKGKKYKRAFILALLRTRQLHLRLETSRFIVAGTVCVEINLLSIAGMVCLST